MLLIWNKLKQARELTGMTLTEVAQWMHWKSHNYVSRLEKGGSKFIPLEYHTFLLHHRIDLNSLYDNKQIEVKQFIQEPIGLRVAEDREVYEKPKKIIKNEAHYLEIIQQQQATINEQQITINNLILGNVDTQTKAG